jgi:hypothetical protein
MAEPIEIDLSEKERHFETTVSEEQFVETVKRDPYEASQLLSEAFKKIEIHDAVVKTMFVSQRVMNLLSGVMMKSGEVILSKTPYGLKFWTASVIMDDHVPDIELSSEEQPKCIPMFSIQR